MDVTFREKLLRLTGDASRADLDRRAGLPVNSVANIINRRSLPRVDNALALARALGVSLDWLADDTRSWPPTPHDYAARADNLLPDDVRNTFEKISEQYSGRAVVTAAAIDVFIHAEKQTQVLAVTHALMKERGTSEEELSRFRQPVDPQRTILGAVRTDDSKRNEKGKR